MKHVASHLACIGAASISYSSRRQPTLNALIASCGVKDELGHLQQQASCQSTGAQHLMEYK
jgi:hypothetical protein